MDLIAESCAFRKRSLTRWDLMMRDRKKVHPWFRPLSSNPKTWSIIGGSIAISALVLKTMSPSEFYALATAGGLVGCWLLVGGLISLARNARHSLKQ